MHQEKFDLICKNIRDIGHLAWEAEELREHDAAQRAMIEQQAQEIEQLKKDKLKLLGVITGNYERMEKLRD